MAGSENLAQIGVVEGIYKEGVGINESLHCLGRVIECLSLKIPIHRVNYNVHPLTAVLQDSLGGKAKTVMLINIAPSIFNLK